MLASTAQLTNARKLATCIVVESMLIRFLYTYNADRKIIKARVACTKPDTTFLSPQAHHTPRITEAKNAHRNMNRKTYER